MASQAVTIGSESISGSLQGVELRTFGQVYQGMMPKIRPLNSNILVVDGQRIDNLQKFDENLTTLVGTKKVEEFPNFEREELSFGMPRSSEMTPSLKIWQTSILSLSYRTRDRP